MTRPIDVLHSLKPVFIPLVIFAGVTNLAVLTSPLFMMQVLDRVVPSGNLNTLALLGMLAAGALFANAVVEFLRDQVLSRTATWFEPLMARLVLANRTPARLDRMRDLATLRDFIQFSAVTMVDLPWIPFFLIAVFLIHPAFLVLLLGGVTILTCLKIATAKLTRDAEEQAQQARIGSLHTLNILEREGPLADLMNVGENLSGRYLTALDGYATAFQRSSRATHSLDALGRMIRMGMQLSTLSLGAYLVTQAQLSAGGMIGASIILAKTLGILEASIGLVPQLKEAVRAVKALAQHDGPSEAFKTEIHDLSGAISVQGVTYPRGGGAAPRLERINLKVAAGECLAILGESGSGKTTLLNAMCGADPAPIGNVFFDETDVRTIDYATKSGSIGYLAQQAQLISGTIAENIACFATQRDDQKVVAAARLAGVHGMISALPNAYETDLGAEARALSAGQKQRIAFARAIYERPKYLFLDEPNALLDHMGERQLGDAIARLKGAGITIVMTLHRMVLANLADKAAVLERGRLIDFGPRAEIVGRLANSHRRLKLPAMRSDVQDLVDWVHGQFVRDGDDDFRRRASVVATEMFNFARSNGPLSADRFLAFEFQFVDDHTCSLTVSEPRKSTLQAKVKKVREQVQQGETPDLDTADDEVSLATVIKLSDRFEHKSSNDGSLFFAQIGDHRSTANTPLQEAS